MNAVVFIHETVNAVLQPLVALFADQWTTRVAKTDALAACRTGAHLVTRHGVAPLGSAGLKRKRRYHGLPQDVVASRVYVCEH